MRRIRRRRSKRARSLRRGGPRDRNAGSTRSPSAEQALRLFSSVGLKVGLQQRELDQVVLRAAAANALVFGSERRKHLDPREKIPAPAPPQPPLQRPQVRPRPVSPPAPHL